MREITMLIALILVMPPSTAGTECLGKCDQYEDYYCSPFFGVCEPCVSEDDSPKCKEYFDTMRTEPTKGTPQEPSETTMQQINDTVLPDLMPVTESKPDLGQNDQGRNRLGHNVQKVDPQKGGGKEEKHTDILIIVATATMVTVCIGTVIRFHRRYRSPTGRRTIMVVASDEDEGILEVVVDQISGAAKETALIAQPEEDTTL